MNPSPMLYAMPPRTAFSWTEASQRHGIRAWLNTADQVVTYTHIAYEDMERRLSDHSALMSLMNDRLRELRLLHLLTLYVQYPLWWTGDSVLDLS